MTRAQKKWLKVLNDTGFVEMGGWGRGQKNRPLFALCNMGLATFDIGPPDSCLKVQGFLPAAFGPRNKPPQSPTITGVLAFLQCP